VIAIDISAPLLDGASLQQAMFGLDWPVLGIIPLMLGLISLVSPVMTLRARKKNGFDIPLTFSATERFVTIEHAQGRTDTLWSAFKKAQVKRGRLYLFTSPGCAHIIGRRSFVNQDDFDQWAEYAHRAIAEAKSVCE
jgi:YcxB-like protein